MPESGASTPHTLPARQSLSVRPGYQMALQASQSWCPVPSSCGIIRPQSARVEMLGLRHTVVVNFLLCLIYKLSFITDMYVQGKQYITGLGTM